METFHIKSSYKLAIVAFIPTSPFSKQKLVLFKCYLNEKEALHSPTFYMKMNHCTIVSDDAIVLDITGF